MKKTLTVNLNGRVFNIDEDAYELLDDYLRNLRIYFRKEEGSSEIIADFEARIEELFREYIQQGHEVITIEQVESLIGKMGKPEDFGEPEEKEEKKETGKSQSGAQSSSQEKEKKKFFRDGDDKIFGGVCSGIAAYTGWDVVAVRLGVALFLLVSAGWALPLYLLAWIIVPVARTAQEKLQMRGEKVSVENIGKIVSEEKTEKAGISGKRGCAGTLLDIFVACLKVLLVGIGLIIAIPVLFALFIILIVFIALLFGLGGWLSEFPLMGNNMEILGSSTFLWTALAALFTILIPITVLIYMVIAHFWKLRPMSKGVKLTCLILWIISVLALIPSGFMYFSPIKWNKHSEITILDNITISGNGIPGNKKEILPAFDVIEIETPIISDVQLHFSATDSSFLKMQGDSGILDHIGYTIDNGKLKIFIHGHLKMSSNDKINIELFTPSVRDIKTNSVGLFHIPGKLTSENFSIEVDGIGRFQADSVYCGNFQAEVEGIGSIDVSGEVQTARLSVEGTGKIESSNLIAGEIEAQVEGIGKIDCNPVKKLKARVDGLGKINYVNEPETSTKRVNGLGKINKK